MGREGGKDLLELPHPSLEQGLGDLGKGNTTIAMRSPVLAFVQAPSAATSPLENLASGPHAGAPLTTPEVH